MNTYAEVKYRILYFLNEKNISIYELSLRSGVPASSIKNILYGKSKNPGIVTIKQICDGFGISLFDFFDFTAFQQTEPEEIT